MRGPVAAAEDGRALDQEQLQALGAWRNRRTGRYQAPTRSTIHRVVMQADAQELEATLQGYATRGCQQSASSPCRLRIRRASRRSAQT